VRAALSESLDAPDAPPRTTLFGAIVLGVLAAHQVGGSRQSVNAALRGFERRGWIEVHDRAVTVKHAAALGRFANQVSAS
jgi:hypothetical protein